ncbi:MAG: 50S ribosomal protein L10 [Cytophagales bacterium]|nr:50S ribosomal protein L10 [Cytophagales bacterium]
MTREEKGQIIDELAEKFSQHNHFYFTDASGFSVVQINTFRRICFKTGVEYRVYKNTLIQKALEKQTSGDFEPMFKVLKGFTGVIFSKEIGNAPAKAIKEYRVKNEGKPVFKGASIQSDLYFGEENLNTLNNLKSKNEMIGDILSALQAPAKNVLSALLSSKGTLAGLVKTLEQRAK